MKGIGHRFTWTVSISAAFVGLAAIGFAAWHWSLFSAHNTILELRDLPVHSPVHLLGVVTYTDEPGNRFWIEDETGATVVPVNPEKLDVHVGETISLDAMKTGPYDPIQGPASFGLAHVQVHSSGARVKLPPPYPVTLANFPTPDKNGLRMRVTAVVQDASLDMYGRLRLTYADSGIGNDLIVAKPDGDYSKLVNANVEIVGLTEQSRNSQGGLLQQQIWVPSSNDIKIMQPAPSSSPVYSIRDLYRKSGIVGGHLVHVRGRVAMAFPNSVLLEDRWGLIECHLEREQEFAVGDSIEVSGFPGALGIAIALYHAKGVAIPPEQIDRQNTEDREISPLTTTASIRQLRRSRAANALPVRISGVITYLDPIWQQLFVQDKTGGIYLKYAGHQPGLHVGEQVTVIGITGPGNYAPVILAPKFEIGNDVPLPTPVPVTTEDATAGLLDSQYVTVDGVVHPMKFAEEPSHPILTFELYTAVGQIHVFTSPGFPDLRQSRNLEDARVRIQGVLGTIFNSRRQLVGYQLLVSSESHIQTIEAAVSNPFETAATPIGSLLSFSPGTRFGHRVKVAGSVTMVGRDFLYVQDGSGGVEVRGDAHPVRVGQRIEAIGYPTLEGRYSPVITDSELRILPGESPIQPVATDAGSILQGQYDSQLVTVEGRLLTTLRAPGSEVLVLQSGIETFMVQLDTTDLEVSPIKLREGSVLRLTGVCSVQINPRKVYRLLQEDPVSFKILLRSPADATVIRNASLWTPQMLLPLLGLLALLIVVILAWVDVLRRRVRRQAVALQRASQTAQAIHDLSTAMQEVSLEQRFDTQVSVRGSEDIAQLVVGFNRMLAQLQQRDRAKREAEAMLQHQALIDELTSLPNRRLLSDRLNQSLAAARRENSIVALLYIDLDGFKLVNDSLGHAAGDLLLTEVAQRLKMRIRESDTLARIGGDEFTVILNHIESKEGAEKFATDLLDCLSAPFNIEGHEITVGASIGISSFPDLASEDDNLLQQADSAMYAAKRSGKNRIVHFSSDMGTSVRERLTLETELRRAVANGDISIHYQPEFDLSTGTIVRFEALARWTHPNLGVIPPLRFIPVAEECGIIVPLGALVLERACTEALSWQALSDHPIQVAVNVSSIQFAREGFVEEIVEILDRTGLAPGLLQLELTESATLLGIQHAATMIQRLKDLGINVAMDDFGTGYSCLSYLPKLAFNALKIDRTFVNEVVNCTETRALVQSILTLAHNLDMKVIVEGIENHEQLKLISELGGNEAQGYLLGRPTPDPRDVLRKKRASDAKAHSENLEPAMFSF
jgi:diguanylate cyclase (GGDEF)-like protein